MYSGLIYFCGVKTIKGTTMKSTYLYWKRDQPSDPADKHQGILTLTWVKSQNTVWLRTGGKQIEEDVIQLGWRPGIHQKADTL